MIVKREQRIECGAVARSKHLKAHLLPRLALETEEIHILGLVDVPLDFLRQGDGLRLTEAIIRLLLSDNRTTIDEQSMGGAFPIRGQHGNGDGTVRVVGRPRHLRLDLRITESVYILLRGYTDLTLFQQLRFGSGFLTAHFRGGIEPKSA